MTKTGERRRGEKMYLTFDRLRGMVEMTAMAGATDDNMFGDQASPGCL